MTKVLQFRKNTKQPKTYTPRRRVFYIGYRYVGPFLCQDIQHLYLKRHGWKNGKREWSMISYVRFQEDAIREYSWDWETCEEDDVQKMLEEFDMGDEVSIEQLRAMGWNGRIKGDGKVHYLYPKEEGEKHG